MMALERGSTALNQDWANRLLTDPSPATRANAAEAVATAFSNGALSERERRIAIDILELLSHDVAQRVREAVSEHLKKSQLLPRSVAITLARDVESVALPVIEHSQVLNDDDLIAIIHGHNGAKQIAIAKRETVSPLVTDALAETANRDVVGAKFGNKRAEKFETPNNKVMGHLGQDDGIQNQITGP